MSEQPTNGTINAILQSIKTGNALQAKTDQEIAKLLLDHIWSTLPLNSPQSDLVDEAIMRLDPSKRNACFAPMGCDCPKCVEKFGPIHPDNVGKDLRSNPRGEVTKPRRA